MCASKDKHNCWSTKVCHKNFLASLLASSAFYFLSFSMKKVSLQAKDWIIFAFCLLTDCYVSIFRILPSLFLLSKHFRGEHGFSFFHLEFWSGTIELLFILLYQPIYMSQKHFLRNAKMGNAASDELSGLLVIELGNLGSKISHYDAKWIHMLFRILLKRVLFSVFSFT